MANYAKICPSDAIEFTTPQPARIYHDKKCQRRAQNATARKDSLLEQVIAYKGSRACSRCKATTGKRWLFFWNDYDHEDNNLNLALLLRSRWARYRSVPDTGTTILPLPDPMTRSSTPLGTSGPES